MWINLALMAYVELEILKRFYFWRKTNLFFDSTLINGDLKYKSAISKSHNVPCGIGVVFFRVLILTMIEDF